MKGSINEILSRIKDNWKYYMNGFKQLFNDLKHRDTLYKQVPNLLTISRVLGMIPVNILFFTGNMLLGTILLGILLSTDFFDGKIARRYGIVSKFGAELDAICDKIISFCLMIPLLINNPLVIINLLLEFIIAVINIVSKLKGNDVNTLYSGKIKTWILSFTMGFGYLSKFIPSLNNIFILFSVLTISSQIITAYDYMYYNSFLKKNIMNENKDDEIKIKFELSKEELLMELKKEKEFLLSINNIEKNNINIRKRKK